VPVLEHPLLNLRPHPIMSILPHLSVCSIRVTSVCLTSVHNTIRSIQSVQSVHLLDRTSDPNARPGPDFQTLLMSLRPSAHWIADLHRPPFSFPSTCHSHQIGLPSFPSLCHLAWTPGTWGCLAPGHGLMLYRLVPDAMASA
jgi:hypothetical protein